MMKVKAMRKITVFGPRTYMKEIIEELYNMNVVHIEDFTKKSEEELFDIGEPFEQNERYADLLVKVRTLISNLDIAKSEVDPSSATITAIENKTQEIYNIITKLLAKKEYFSQIKKIYDLNAIEKALGYLKFEEDVDFSTLLHFVGFIDANLETIQEETEKITNKYMVYTVSYEGITLLALLADKKKKDKIQKMLEKCDFSPIDNPVVKEHYNLKSKSGVKFVKLDYQAKVIEKKLQKITSELNMLKDEHFKFLLESETRLKMETDKAEIPLKFATTKNTFLIKGWLPNENVKKLDDSLNKITKGRVMLKFEKPEISDDVPIVFNHPKIVEPFEAFMNLYTLPTYKEIDPTFFMFLTFPIFFGFMLGDVGYGLVIYGIFSLLKKKMPGAKNILNAFIIAAIASMVFGVVFGEYFGFEELPAGAGEALGIHPEEITAHGETKIIYSIPHLFARSHSITDLLSIVILFGIVHLLIGFVIGFINVKRAHGLKHAIYEKGGWILIMPFIVWLLLNFLGIISGFVADMINIIMPPLIVVAILFGIGAILVIKGEGIIGLIEIIFFALLSNILSYARLMAVGLASLSLASVVNDLAGQMFKSGIIGILFGILILILGHAINIALGILSPFLHSLRLHYVEFFTKFFHGGGRKYHSFGHSE